MLFATFLGCIESIATLNDDATAGNIQKMNSHLSVGQVKRALKQLETEGYVRNVLMPYGRTGKRVYRLTNLCMTNVYITNNKIDAMVSTEIEAA